MPKQTFNWKRFWCLPAGHVNLSDSGFLVDPDGPYGPSLNPDVMPWESITQGPCLILLGEPGIGKSSALESEKKRAEQVLSKTEDQLLWVDLRRYNSDQRLHEHVFESEVVKAWRSGTSRLHLFLDSMDECLMRIENVGPVLVGELSELPIERLSVRIACRTADWPRRLEDQFRNLWREENVAIYELAPLRRADVLEAARASGIEPATTFVDRVIHSGAVPLAIKPVTLQFLLNTYQRFGNLPSDQTQLYANGCGLLCEESREALRPTPSSSDLAAEQRLAVASRIAAVTVFCGRDAVWTDIDRGDVPDADVRIAEIAAETVAHTSAGVRAGEYEIWQALNTGLFSSRGLPRIGWAHQTYAEFLAARFLIENHFWPERIMSLLIHPDGRIVPQLHETAAWVASMVSEVFRKIMAVDPEMLLWSDVMTADASDRMALVERLLELFDQGRLMDFDWDLRRRYRKLNHHGLNEQLRPYIRDKQKGIIVRRVAIGIADACKIRSLEDDLVAVSLDQTDAHEVRVEAAFAISQWGHSESKNALWPLAIGSAGDDPDDDLKGCGLVCAWPERMSAADLFGTLTPPRRSHRFGMYWSFLRQPIAESLAVKDLPAALAWTETQQGRDSLSPLARLSDEIKATAIDHLDCLEVAAALASATWKWAKDIYESQEQRAFRQRLVSNTDRRRILVLQIIPIAMGTENWPFYLFHAHLLFGSDFFWLLDQLSVASTEVMQRALMELVKRTFRAADAEQGDALRVASRTSATLAAEFTWFLVPESSEAAAMRQQVEEWESSIPKPEAPVLLDPPPDQRVATLLTRFETGDLDAFWRLNLELTLERDSTHYGDPVQPCLKVLPGWTSASDETRRRIVAAASRYLTEYVPPRAEDWLKTDSTPWASLAGYRALLLLLTEQPGFLSTLSAGVWTNWAPITLAYPYHDDGDLKDLRLELLKRAYQGAPEIVLETLNNIIDKENESHGTLFVLSQIDPIWDTRMAAFLVAKAEDQSLKPGAFGGLLDDLLKHGVPQAREIAKATIEALPTESGVERERAVVAARCLMRSANDAGWSIVWPVVTRDNEFGLRALEGVSSIFEPQASAMFTRLADDQLTDLYIWLVTKVPYPESAQDHSGFGMVSPRRSLEMWRDRLLEHLKSRGTGSSAAGIRRIVSTFPQYPWLTWQLMEAERLARFNSWSPLRPPQLFALLADAERRLVQNGEQLLDILMESLTRLQQEMQGETPTAFVLWNELPAGVLQPKIEVRISDYVKTHFDRDIKARGIVVNREVEIRKGTGAKPGEETDIHVDAVTQLPNGTYDRISAIVEVKGCWNRELMTAMKGQLADRYLKDNACPFGLYLVGWFMCDQWDGQDYRRAATPKMTVEEAQAHFDNQAANLSDSSRQIRAFVLDAAL